MRIVILALGLVACGDPPATATSAPPTEPAPVAEAPSAMPAFVPPIEWERAGTDEANERIAAGATADAFAEVTWGASPRGPLGTAIDGMLDGVRACYTVARIAHPWLHGRVYLGVDLASDGSVTGVELVEGAAIDPPAEWWIVGSTDADLHAPRTLETCIVADVRHWHLPSSAARVVVMLELDVASRLEWRRERPDGFAWGEGVLPPLDRIAMVRTDTPTASSGLSVDVVRRVIRRHVNEVRFCYEQGLYGARELAGRADARFVVSATGAVASAEEITFHVEPADGPHAGVDRVRACIRTAIRRWTFPAPEGEEPVTVEITYHLSSVPDDGAHVGRHHPDGLHAVGS